MLLNLNFHYKTKTKETNFKSNMYGNNVAGNLKLYVNWQWYNMYGNNVCFLTSLALDDT